MDNCEDNNSTRAKLTEIFRRFKPTLILAHSLEDYHPDHRAAGKLAEAASWFCASSGYKTRSLAMGNSPALWWMDTLNMSGFAPEFYIDISEFVRLKSQMLDCHASQLQRGRDKDFSPLGELMRAAIARARHAGGSRGGGSISRAPRLQAGTGMVIIPAAAALWFPA